MLRINHLTHFIKSPISGMGNIRGLISKKYKTIGEWSSALVNWKRVAEELLG